MALILPPFHYLLSLTYVADQLLAKVLVNS